MEKINKELKFILKDSSIIEKLRNSNAVLIGGSKEKTIRYDDKDNNLEKQGKFVRVRTGFDNIISLKEKINETNDDTVFIRKDVEIEVDDVDNLDHLLKGIGLKQVGIMEKYRLKWNYNGNMINLDELPFGLFLEIHGEEESIFKIVEELNIDNEKMFIGTYWDIFDIYKSKNKNLKNEVNIMFEEGYSYLLAKL